MSEYSIEPQQISYDDFVCYRKNWEGVISKPKDNLKELRDCFTSTDPSALINYAYLPIDSVNALINTPDTTHIQVVFVVATPSSTPIAPGVPCVFSVVLVPIDDYGNPTAAVYLLAGVAGFPAKLADLPQAPQTASVEISNLKAGTWTHQWHEQTPESLAFESFASEDDAQNRLLRGYTYNTADFRDALGDGNPTQPYLWLDFALHGDAPLQFAITICLNQQPADNPTTKQSGEIDFIKTQHYYDLSRPCPPCCYVSMPLPLPQA